MTSETTSQNAPSDNTDNSDNLIVEKIEAGRVDETNVSEKELIPVACGFMLSFFLANMDQTILATALPAIANRFQALQEITWVATAYLLTQSGLMLLVGQLLVVIPSKYVYIASLAIFLFGSLLCGVSTSLAFLIAGRAVAGCGGAGIVTSVMCIIAEIVKMDTRPVLFGLLGAMYAIASILGPILGGAFTVNVSWRWCFYINLPIGAVAIAVTYMFLPARIPRRTKPLPETLFGKLCEIDWTGAVLCLAASVCVLLALQFGGNLKPWKSPLVIALFCVFAVLIAAFIMWCYRMGDNALIPLSIFKRRTQCGVSVVAFFIGMSLLSATYYLPLWYQAQGRSAVRSGIDILPFMLSVVIASIVSGAVIKATGYYWHVLVICPLIACIGAGLLSTLDVGTSADRAIGFQILYGIGIGSTLQNIFIAIQAEWEEQPEFMAQATSTAPFLTTLGGVTGVAVGGAIFANQLRTNIAHFAPELSPSDLAAVLQSVGAVFSLQAELREAVITAYVKSLSRTFILGVPACALSGLFALLIKNRSLNKK